MALNLGHPFLSLIPDTMPPKIHRPSTGELIYRSVGERGRFRLVPVIANATPPSASETDVPPPPTPSILPPVAEVLDQNLDFWPPKKKESILRHPKRLEELVLCLLGVSHIKSSKTGPFSDNRST